MRSIYRVFNTISNQNPYWSSFTCFAETVKDRNFGRPAIAQWFNRLIDKGDYGKKHRSTLVEQLYRLSNPEEK
ncbi:hypothetical protein KKG85_01815 [Patescibacteria group bacterium]|nr:hypothetical protein [Patescibacteria group bacterium]MBU2579884.1 hypothetical protein [Patescibacteria group bacterium]